MLIDNFRLVDGGPVPEDDSVLLLSGRYPSRNPDQNMADLKAQIAANEKGVQELRRMVDQFGLDVGARLYGPCAGQCGRIRAPRHRCPARTGFHYPLGQWR